MYKNIKCFLNNKKIMTKHTYWYTHNISKNIKLKIVFRQSNMATIIHFIFLTIACLKYHNKDQNIV